MLVRGTTLATCVATIVVSASAQTDPPTSPSTPLPTSPPTNPPTSSPTQSPTVLVGCPPIWTEGSDYKSGTLVSHPESTTAASILGVYQCKEEPYHLYCPQAGFEPDTLYSENAWSRLGKCNSAIPYVSPTASPSGDPTGSPSYSLWDKVGCPESFDATLGTSYDTGSTVEYGGNVYECTAEIAARCNQAGWEPGVGKLWTEAWTILGRCDGTIVPTFAPTKTDEAAWEKIGCPEGYLVGTSYEERDVVENNGVVYECKEEPYNQFCGQAGYEPGVDTHFRDAWLVLGSCTGTLAPSDSPTASPSQPPTSSPTRSQWELVGCPEEFDTTLQTSYSAGERVEYDGNVYECKPEFPSRCNQAGYEPSYGVEWSEAWTVLGSCSGTIAPTLAPFTEPWEKIGCPEEYSSNEVYTNGTVVALNEVVYMCKQYPDAGFCRSYRPDSDYGDLGWEKLGSCTGTIAPTDAPIISPTAPPSVKPTYEEWARVGCPEAFDESLATAYTAGETVERSGVVYECKPWPESPRCNQAG